MFEPDFEQYNICSKTHTDNAGLMTFPLQWSQVHKDHNYLAPLEYDVVA